jgi:phospholipid/cholesterol/gamma-HCH transport system permease protein
MLQRAENLGRSAVRHLDEIGYASALLSESRLWTFAGWRWRQPVRLTAVLAQMTEMGILALPIATLLSATVGLMLAIQSLYSLGLFGAESFAHVGIALSVTREFSPLIMAILVAGRSGSALAARLSTMSINQEIDALKVIGINPVRFLIAPALLAMLVMLPALTMWANLVALAAAGIYVSAALDLSMAAYLSGTIAVLSPGDLWHGLGKSVLFAALIVLVGVVNGSLVSGGAEGVGRATTRSVVQGISAIVVTDMIFAFVATQ